MLVAIAEFVERRPAPPRSNRIQCVGVIVSFDAEWSSGGGGAKQ
jgi:hypothetical protein